MAKKKVYILKIPPKFINIATSYKYQKMMKVIIFTTFGLKSTNSYIFRRFWFSNFKLFENFRIKIVISIARSSKSDSKN